MFDCVAFRQILHGVIGASGCGIDIVGQVQQKLSETTLSRGVVAEHRREGGIAERLRETLAKGLASASIVTKSMPRMPVSRLL